MTRFGEPTTALDRYLEEVTRIPMMDRDEELAVGTLAFEGDEEARKALVRANLRFAVNTAKKYRGRGVPFMDLIQAANTGLVIAASKFDPNRGVKFISMAVWWIRSQIMVALAEQGSAVKMPQNAHSELMRITRAQSEIMKEEGRKATLDEITERARVTKDQLDRLAPLRIPALRLDRPVSDDHETEWMGIFEGQTTVDPLEGFEENEAAEVVSDALGAMDHERDAIILRLRHGIGVDGGGLTLLQIGFLMGVTRERVRQLQRRAEETLAESPALQTYAENRRAA